MSEDQFNYKVDRFILLQKRKRIQSKERDLTLLDIIEAQEPLPLEKAKKAIEEMGKTTGANPALVQAISERVSTAWIELNRLNRMRRLFALETIYLLGDVDKVELTAQYLLDSDPKGCQSLALAFIRTFPGTDKVIATLAEKKELFSHKVVDSQVHALYTFRFELAEKILKFFNPRYLQEKSQKLRIDMELSLDLLRHILRQLNNKELSSHLKGQDLPLALVDLIAFVQSHRMLPIYAKKRYDFLKLFFLGLSKPGSLPGVRPHHMAMLSACFLELNRQLLPPDALILHLLDEELFAQQETKRLLLEFLEQLAPSTLDAILKDIRDCLRLLLGQPDKSVEEIFADTVRKYDQGIDDPSLLGRVYVTMMMFKTRGMLAIESVLQFFKDLRGDSGKPGEGPELKSMEEIFNEAGEFDSIEDVLVVDKNPASNERLMMMRQINTSVVAWRGPSQGGTRRGLMAMQYLFGDKNQIDHFKKAFLQLFYVLSRETQKVFANEFSPLHAPKPVMEYYAAYLTYGRVGEPLIFALGLTSFEKDPPKKSDKENETLLAEQFIDPYMFLLTSSTEETSTLARSRKINDEEIANLDEARRDMGEIKEGQIGLCEAEFKMCNMQTEDLAQQAYQQLLDLFHFLPPEKWQHPEVQYVVQLLQEKLGIKTIQISR